MWTGCPEAPRQPVVLTLPFIVSLKKFGHFSGFESLLAISYILSFPICSIVHSIISSSSFPWVSAWKVHKYVWVLEFLKNVFILLSFLISSLAEYRVVHQMSFTLRIFKILLQSLLSFTIVLRRLIQFWAAISYRWLLWFFSGNFVFYFIAVILKFHISCVFRGLLSFFLSATCAGHTQFGALCPSCLKKIVFLIVHSLLFSLSVILSKWIINPHGLIY